MRRRFAAAGGRRAPISRSMSSSTRSTSSAAARSTIARQSTACPRSGPNSSAHRPAHPDCAARAGSREGSDVHTVLVTVGGGGDGEALLDCVANCKASWVRRALSTSSSSRAADGHGPAPWPDGPVGGQPGVEVHEYLPDLPCPDGARDLVLSMGGYNTLCEVMGTPGARSSCRGSIRAASQLIRSRGPWPRGPCSRAADGSPGSGFLARHARAKPGRWTCHHRRRLPSLDASPPCNAGCAWNSTQSGTPPSSSRLRLLPPAAAGMAPVGVVRSKRSEGRSGSVGQGWPRPPEGAPACRLAADLRPRTRWR